MDLRANIGQLKTPNDVARLVSILSEMAASLDVLTTDDAPNGAISAREGRIALYNNSGTYEQWINTDGGTTWQRMDYAAGPFVKGDFIISSVNTARTGWTDKSATHANKFMRIAATPLATGGSDTLSGNTGSVTLTAAQSGLQEHYHTVSGVIAGGASVEPYFAAGTTGGASKNTSTVSSAPASEGHAHSLTSVACVPGYVTVCVFEKN